MLKDVFHKQVTLTFVTPLQPEKESMLSSWQQDSPLVGDDPEEYCIDNIRVGDDPEEYCIDNIRVVVLHVNPARKTWNSNDSMTSVTSVISTPEPFSYVHLSKLFAKASERHLHVCSVFRT